MKVICFGDSNTYGYDPRAIFGGRYDTIWVDLLAEKSGWNVVNLGENGREIPRTASFFPEDTNLLIIMLGTNDLLQFQSPEAACWKMERFLADLNLDRRKILLIAPPPMVFGEWVQEQRLIDNSVSLAKCYQTLAQQFDIRFVNAGEWNVPLAFDGVHFTEDGHKAFAEGLYDLLSNESF